MKDDLTYDFVEVFKGFRLQLVFTIVFMKTSRFISTKVQGHYLTFDPPSTLIYRKFLTYF